MKAAREKQHIIYRGTTIEITVYFYWETIEPEATAEHFSRVGGELSTWNSTTSACLGLGVGGGGGAEQYLRSHRKGIGFLLGVMKLF